MVDRTIEDPAKRVVVFFSHCIFLDVDATQPIRHVPPGFRWSGFHVSTDVFNSILKGAGHWHPERA